MTKILLALGAGVGAFWVYNNYKKSTGIGYSPNNGAQKNIAASKAPATSSYPFRAPVTPRVDNSNQPWYSGVRDFITGPANKYPAPTDIAAVANAGASVVNSLSDIFGSDDNPTEFTADDFGNGNSFGFDAGDLPEFSMPDNPFGALDMSGDPTFDMTFAPDGSTDPSSSGYGDIA